MQILKPANFQGRLERVRLLRDYQGDALKAGRLLAGEEVELSHGDAEYLVVGGYAERLGAVPTVALGDEQPEVVVEAVAFGDEPKLAAAAEVEKPAVTRVGVTFSEEQRETIAEIVAMAEAPEAEKPAPRKRAKKSEAANESD